MNRKEFELHVQKLKGGRSKEDASKIAAFFAALDRKGSLPSSQYNMLREQFLEAFEYYLDHGLDVSETIGRLSAERLGDFFYDKSDAFYTLDNAAIVYPLGMKFGTMPMFRLSATLKEDVIPCLLQIALDFTVRRFPIFSTVVKTGFFWHYLESAHYVPVVEEESEIPCKPISILMRSTRSFRVIYFKKRISIEFFHVLTDGSGGLVFLKTLLREYFRLLGIESPVQEDILDITEPPKEEEMVNEFERAKGEDDLNTFFDKPSLQMDGRLTAVNPSGVLHYEMDKDQLKEISRRYGGTITAYLLAVMFEATVPCVKASKGIFNIQVPVNMRKFNGSKTLRNYSMYFSASMDVSEIPDRISLVKEMDRQLKEKGSFENMNHMMMTTGRLIRSVSWVPVFLKAPVVQVAYGYLGNGIIGNTLSNLGVVKMPEELRGHIDHFDFVLIPGRPNRATCSLISYEGKTRFTVISATSDKRFEQEIYNRLTEDGLKVNLEGSIGYGS